MEMQCGFLLFRCCFGQVGSGHCLAGNWMPVVRDFLSFVVLVPPVSDAMGNSFLLEER